MSCDPVSRVPPPPELFPPPHRARHPHVRKMRLLCTLEHTQTGREAIGTQNQILKISIFKIFPRFFPDFSGFTFDPILYYSTHTHQIPKLFFSKKKNVFSKTFQNKKCGLAQVYNL